MILSLLGYMMLGVLGVLIFMAILMVITAISDVALKNPIIMFVCIGIIIGILAWLYFEVMGYGTHSVSVASITDPRIPWDK